MKAIYTYASESSYYTLSENDMVYKCLRHRSWNIAVKIPKFVNLNPNISEIVCHSIINNTIS